MISESCRLNVYAVGIADQCHHLTIVLLWPKNTLHFDVDIYLPGQNGSPSVSISRLAQAKKAVD